MKTKTKALLITMCAALLVVATVFTTLAFLTDTESAVNTFTVGNVQIDLDEAKVDLYGNQEYTDEAQSIKADRVKANDYKLIPNHTYLKDPTAYVKAGSEDCYVRMFVTMTQKDAFQTVLGQYKTGEVNKYANDCLFVKGEDGNYAENWTLERTYTDTDSSNSDTITFEFRCSTKFSAGETVTGPFSQIKVPEEFTNEDLAKIDGSNTVAAENQKNFKMYVVAQAIQKDGFTTAEAAFNAAPAITGSDLTP